jgi:hypothetical protein
MAYNKPTHFTKVTLKSRKTGKEFETGLGNTLASIFNNQGETYSGLTAITLTIDGQEVHLPLSVRATPITTEKGTFMKIGVNLSEAYDVTGTRQVAYADIAKSKAAAPAPAVAPKGVVITGGAAPAVRRPTILKTIAR